MSDNPVIKQDSPLSIIASVAGIFTVLIAIAATIYARLSYLSSADAEYFQVKRSLNFYKTESAWMKDVVKSRKLQHSANNTSGLRYSGDQREYEMYAFVIEELRKLEERLLELLAGVELEVSKGESRESGGKGKLGSWTLVPRRYSFKTGTIASAWVPIRTKALELVRQREALCPRVLSAQLSMVLSRVQDQENRSHELEASQSEKIAQLETKINSQHEKLDNVQDLVYRVLLNRRTLLSKDSKQTSREIEAVELK